MLHAVPAAVSYTLVLCCRFLAGRPGRCSKGGQALPVYRSGLLLGSHGRCQLTRIGEQAGLNLILNVDMYRIPAGQQLLQSMPCTGVPVFLIVVLSLSSRRFPCPAGTLVSWLTSMLARCVLAPVLSIVAAIALGQAFGQLPVYARVQAASAVCAVCKAAGWPSSSGDACCTAASAVPPQLWAACEPADQTASSTLSSNTRSQTQLQ